MKKKANIQVLDAVLRTDVPSFVHKAITTIHPGARYMPNWHISAIAEILRKAEAGHSKRVIINLPPRTLKSSIISVAWVAWLLGHNPRLRIIVASYSEGLAKKFNNDFRAVVKSDWYQRIFPVMAKPPLKDGEMEYVTFEHGYRLAVTVNGALTGRGADIIIIDDPIKASDVTSETMRQNTNEWLPNSLFSRHDNLEKGVILLVMQRLHENDPSGFLLEQGGYEHLSIPAIAPENEPAFQLLNGKTYQRRPNEPIQPAYCSYEALLKKREELGSHIFEAQYQQNPVPAGGNYFRPIHFSNRYTAEELKALEPFDYKVSSWDTASKIGVKNDYSVGTFWGVKNEKLYLLKVIRRRFEFPKLLEYIRQSNIDIDTRHCIIEDTGVGTALIQSLENQNDFIVYDWKPENDKKIRAEVQLGVFENNKVIFPSEADWLGDYIKEFMAFPNGKHEDQVDSTTQFFAWHKANQSEFAPLGMCIVY